MSRKAALRKSLKELTGSAPRQRIAQRFRHHKREVSWVTIGQFLALGGGFWGIKALTKALGPEQYGELALGLSVSGLLFSFIYAPFASAVIRYYSVYREKKALSAYFSVLVNAHVFFGGINLLLAALAAIVIKVYFALHWMPIILGGILLGMSNGIYSSLLSVFSAMRERKGVAMQQGAEVCARVLLALLLIHGFVAKGSWSLLGFFLGNFSVVLMQIYFLKRHELANPFLFHPELISAKELKPVYDEFYRFAAPMVLFAIFGWTTSYADRWVISGYLGLTEVGIYAALYQVANAPMTIITGVIGQLVNPVVFERAGTLSHPSQFQRSLRVFRFSCILSAGLFAGVVVTAFFFGHPIVQLLTTAEFAKSYKILWVLTLGVALFQMANTLTLKGLYFNMPKIYITPKICHAIAFLLCAYWSVPRYGLLGMAWTWVVASAGYTLFVLIANRACEHKPMPASQEITPEIQNPESLL